jgi:hypothetical protein
MLPSIVGEVAQEIKKLVKSLVDNEFEIDVLNEEAMEEEKGKVIPLKRIIWRGLGKEAFNQWFIYYNDRTDSNNSLMLGIMMYRQLLENTYTCIKEVEFEEEKKKPRPTRSSIAQKRPVTYLSQ